MKLLLTAILLSLGSNAARADIFADQGSSYNRGCQIMIAAKVRSMLSNATGPYADSLRSGTFFPDSTFPLARSTEKTSEFYVLVITPQMANQTAMTFVINGKTDVATCSEIELQEPVLR